MALCSSSLKGLRQAVSRWPLGLSVSFRIFKTVTLSEDSEVLV